MTPLDDRSLDDLLARSAPSVPTTEALAQQVDDLVRAGARPPRRRRGVRRLVVGGTAVVLAFAGVSAAAASPWAPEWLAWNPTRPDRVGSTAPDPLAERVRGVIGVIARLPPIQRELVELVHWDGFSLTEAAALLEVPASTVRTRYATARAALALLLQGEPSRAGRG